MISGLVKQLLIVAFSFSSFSLAAEAKDMQQTELPGVKPQKPIVTAPPPAPDQASRESGKHFRVGNTDVSILGDVIIDVGAGQNHRSGH
ncbi:hypothetical protein BR10RB9215_C10690 [Brucella sp. 10RB9215]|uniref:hypothetical protein n=1 Tax=Brucella sp. 10RB9215 TaxID=1149953 RepID=UPI00090AD005|nr:hypothetical protein [Brucella sp. 10RB9215]SBW13875.1 hypothetical protein BR10RB9215_C10690 [Brucella sp. 10RB9215]